MHSWIPWLIKRTSNLIYLREKKENRVSVFFMLSLLFSKNLLFPVTFLYGIIDWSGIQFEGHVYPAWAEAIGWMLALMSMICLPIGLVHWIWEKKSGGSYSTSGYTSSIREVWFHAIKSLWFYLSPKGLSFQFSVFGLLVACGRSCLKKCFLLKEG